MAFRFLVLILAAWSGFPPYASASDLLDSVGLKCSLSLDSTNVGALEPVWLSIACTNKSEDSRWLLVGADVGVGLRVRPSESGEICSAGRISTPVRPVRPVVLEVPALATARARMLLNNWFHLAAAGDYEVDLIDCNVLRVGGPKDAMAVSAAVRLNVLPLDERRLGSVCALLAEDALSSDDEKAREAAEALASVESPVAVPYLKKVLDANVFTSYFAVSGLARINSPETARILIDAFDGVEVFTRGRIQNCLYQMKPTIDDSVLRARLDSIFAWELQIVE